ncbi:MAG: BFD-like (2Fe-2S) protein [Desulfobulbaceae bacterium]|nr:BFD-like (2Fe-2S) protein [Desulfobulbaceae bacterium]
MEELICYCFQYTATDIREDVLIHGRSTIIERIAAEKRGGSCQCVAKNPKGR